MVDERRYPDYTKTEHAFRDKTDKLILYKHPWKEYKLHFVVFVLVIISVLIGEKGFSIGSTVKLVLMPLLYALLMGIGLYLWKRFTIIQRKQSAIAEGAMLLFIGPLIAKLAVSSGQSLGILLNVGPAIIAQEFGNLGTIFFGLPIALLLGFGKEAIGMTHSIGREPNVAIIIDKFGFFSPEANGVLSIFIIGSVIGTAYISFLTSFLVSVLPLHPYAFAMASGVGSASMNAAALAPLLTIFPQYKTNMIAFAGFSNLISFCLGIYVCIFIAIPLTQKLYKILKPRLRKHKNRASKQKYNYLDDGTKQKINKHRKEVDYDLFDESESISFDGIVNWTTLLAIFSIIVVVANFVGYDYAIGKSTMGMVILSLISLTGLYLERYIPLNISSIIYVSLIGIFVACPISPINDFVIYYVSNIELISIVTVFLAYVGIGIGNNWDKFKAMGWRTIIVTLFVITGTYVGSLIIAHIVLVLTGTPL